MFVCFRYVRTFILTPLPVLHSVSNTTFYILNPIEECTPCSKARAESRESAAAAGGRKTNDVVLIPHIHERTIIDVPLRAYVSS